MRIANWNLERVPAGGVRSRRIASAMADVDADVWILTETNRSATPGNGYQGFFSGVPERPSAPDERWVAIWSRLSVEDVSDSVGDTTRRLAVRIAESELGELVVYGCVLPWTTDPYAMSTDNTEAYAQALHEQQADWDGLRRRFPNATLIVAGDFNQDLADAHYYGSKRKRALLRQGLRDSGLVCLTAGDLDPVKPLSPYACIDHICVSGTPPLQRTEAGYWPATPEARRGLSDHFGFWVDVTRR